jgi:hypothetical protein
VLGRIPGVLERVKLGLLVETAGKRLQASHSQCVCLVWCLYPYCRDACPGHHTVFGAQVRRLLVPTSRLTSPPMVRSRLSRRKFAAAVRAAFTRLLRILLIFFIISLRPPRYHFEGP